MPPNQFAPDVPWMHPSQLQDTIASTLLDTVQGQIRWRKSSGHPLLSLAEKTNAIPGHAVTLCVGFLIDVWKYIRDPKEDANNPMPLLLVKVDEAKITCWQGPSDPDQNQLSYRIAAVPRNKTVFVTVYTADREDSHHWVPGSDGRYTNGNGPKFVPTSHRGTLHISRHFRRDDTNKAEITLTDTEPWAFVDFEAV